MSRYPVINAGTTPNVTVLNEMLPLVAYKSGSQSVTSNNSVLVNDTALVLPLEATATYKVELLLFYTGGTAGSSDIKWDFAVPSGATLSPIRELGLNTSLGVQYLTVASGGAFGSNGTGNKMCAEIACTLATSITAGNLQFQWCQNTSSATATTVLTGSLLTARRLA